MCTGKRTILNYFSKKEELEVEQSHLKSLIERNNRLKNKIKRISDESLDLDLLDEVSREYLGKSDRKDEVILINKQ